MSIAAFACYGDNRKMGYCVHCGGPDQSRDHVPSKVLLDEPFPENMLVSPSCLSCNQGFSLDEEYLACLIECVLIGDVDPAKIERQRIAEILTKNSRLAEMLKKSRVVKESGIVEWQADTKRITAVLLKLARGHVAYELNEPQLEEPEFFAFKPLLLMTESERNAFEDDGPRDLADEPFWPEVGSRRHATNNGRGQYAFGRRLADCATRSLSVPSAVRACRCRRPHCNPRVFGV